MNGNSPLTVSQILAAIERQKMKALATFLLVMLLVCTAFIYWPRKYGSEGRLFVQQARKGAGLDPVTSQSAVSIQDSPETEIRSIVEIIKSHAVLNEVVMTAIDPVSKQVLTADDVTSTRSTIADELLKSDFEFSFPIPKLGSSGGGGGELSAEEHEQNLQQNEAIKKLRGDLTVAVEKQTSLININVQSRTPKLSQTIANRIMEVTREKHLQAQKVQGASDFFQSEFEAHQVILDNAIKAQKEFRSQNNFLSINGKRNSLQSVIDKLESAIIDREAAKVAAKQRLDKLATELAQLKEQVEVPTLGVERSGYDASYAEYFRLKAERESLAGTFKDNHPRIVRMDKQLVELETTLRSMEQDRTEYQMVRNPIYEQVKINHVDALTSYEATIAELDNLKQKNVQAFEELKRVNDLQPLADQKQRDVEHARQFLAPYAQKFSESKMMAQLDSNDISDVVVHQSANLDVKKVSPKGSVFLPLGFIAAVLMSVMTALFFDTKKALTNSQREEQVEASLELPVMITLPKVYSRRNMVN